MHSGARNKPFSRADGGVSRVARVVVGVAGPGVFGAGIADPDFAAASVTGAGVARAGVKGACVEDKGLVLLQVS